MFEFQVQFDQPLKTVTCSDAKVTTHVIASKEAENFDAPAYQTLQAIDAKLQRFQNTLTETLATIQSSTARLAIEIANTVLQDEDAVARRVTFVTELALSQSHPSLPRQVFVHPNCVPAIEVWIEKSKLNLQVLPDESVSPGDCRIEHGESGILATLDNYLAAAYETIISEDAQQEPSHA